MIRAFYGIDINPFSIDNNIVLLPHQQDVFDVLKVHSFQGGLCLLMGEPGTGKSMIKNVINQKADKTTIVVNVARTLHTYFNTVKILCNAFNIEPEGSSFKLEKYLIEEAYNLKNHGKNIIVIIDDAHLMDMNTLRKLRLLFEDFPRNHNIILSGHVQLLHNMALTVNEDIKSRVTYSTILKKLNPDDMEAFILKELDTAGLPHNTFTENALALPFTHKTSHTKSIIPQRESYTHDPQIRITFPHQLMSRWRVSTTTQITSYPCYQAYGVSQLARGIQVFFLA
jgi:MSHA biogenesis protein MshM